MPTTDDDTNPDSNKQPIEVAPDGHLEVPASVARSGTRGSKRTVLVLGVSIGAAALVLGLFLALQAPHMEAGDKQPGEVSAAGTVVTDPAVAAMVTAPAIPAPPVPAPNAN